MTPWQWWAGSVADIDVEGVYPVGECASREEAIAAACREYGAGVEIEVLEARSSTSMKYEGAACLPFIFVRNKERLITGLRTA